MLDGGGEGWGAPCEPTPDVEITIVVAFGTHRVMAYVFGSWAVHRAIPGDIAGVSFPVDPESWSVVHVPSGLGMPDACGIDFWDAIRVARALDDTGMFLGAKVPKVLCTAWFIVESAVAAAMYDQYVWPLSTWKGSR